MTGNINQGCWQEVVDHEPEIGLLISLWAMQGNHGIQILLTLCEKVQRARELANQLEFGFRTKKIPLGRIYRCTINESGPQNLAVGVKKISRPALTSYLSVLIITKSKLDQQLYST